MSPGTLSQWFQLNVDRGDSRIGTRFIRNQKVEETRAGGRVHSNRLGFGARESRI